MTPPEPRASDALLIVVGADGSNGARSAMEWCAAMAARLDARVIAVAVLDPPQPLVPVPRTMAADVLGAEEAALAGELDTWCEPLRAAAVSYTPIVRTGDPALVLENEADAADADLLVVGRRARGRIREAIIGSVPHSLAHHATRPLVIVPE